MAVGHDTFPLQGGRHKEYAVRHKKSGPTNRDIDHTVRLPLIRLASGQPPSPRGRLLFPASFFPWRTFAMLELLAPAGSPEAVTPHGS